MFESICALIGISLQFYVILKEYNKKSLLYDKDKNGFKVGEPGFRYDQIWDPKIDNIDDSDGDGGLNKRAKRYHLFYQ